MIFQIPSTQAIWLHFDMPNVTKLLLVDFIVLKKLYLNLGGHWNECILYIHAIEDRAIFVFCGRE